MSAKRKFLRREIVPSQKRRDRRENWRGGCRSRESGSRARGERNETPMCDIVTNMEAKAKD